jgi:ABC-2 type transport system ATP-binding protein
LLSLSNTLSVAALPDSLTCTDLSKRYGTGPAIIEGFTHSFEPRTVTSLVGPNGSGKTTLARVLSVLSFPTTGSVRYGDIDIHESPYKYLQHVGLVDDAAELPHYLSAVELLEWIARERGTFDDLGDEGMAAILDRVLLDERRTELIGTYSSGMVKKTQLAAALAADPSVMILDEPFRGLDSAAFDAVIEIVREVTAEGGITILSTHRLEIVESLSDVIIEMPGARIRSTNA